MKVTKRTLWAIISPSVTSVVRAGTIFLILGYDMQIVGGLKVDPITTHRAPHQFQQCQYGKIFSFSHFSIDQFEIGRMFDMALVRGGKRTNSRTMLYMNTRDGDEALSLSTPINLSLVARNLANQALIGCQIWSGGNGFTVLSEQANFGVFAFILGTVGVVPMLALSRAIETSESPFVSGLNLSTNMAVLRLFGATPRPILALFISFLMAATTGIVEETIFRGQSLPAFAVSYGDGDVLTGAVLSTLLFAVLHTNPLSFFKGVEAFIDSSALLVLQIVNGAIFAFLYLFTGNLAVPIITHALYDLYIFYKTHLVDVAGQMKYAREEALMPICSSNRVERKWVSKYGEDWLKEAKESFYLMDVNRDGELSRKELRVALYSYGINLSKSESEKIKQAVDIDGSGSIDFDEYLEFIGPTGSRYKAVRNTLLGPT